jgi:hypothetical protein
MNLYHPIKWEVHKCCVTLLLSRRTAVLSTILADIHFSDENSASGRGTGRARWTDFEMDGRTRQIVRKKSNSKDEQVERRKVILLYCKRPIQYLASSEILTPTPSLPGECMCTCVYPPPPLVRGEDTLAGGRGGGGQYFGRRQTQLCILHM